jgi:hypothetical protein
MNDLGALSPRLRELVDEAVRSGFTAVSKGNSVTLYKAHGKTVTLGVVIYRTDTGAFYSAHRADTRLDVCTAVRTISGVRKVLEL